MEIVTGLLVVVNTVQVDVNVELVDDGFEVDV